jgi:hypothetical protein
MLRGIAAVFFGMVLQFGLAHLGNLKLPAWAAGALGLGTEAANTPPTAQNVEVPSQQPQEDGPWVFSFGDCGPMDLAVTRLDPEVLLNAAAETLSLTPDDLKAELEQGRTLGEIADERGVSRDGLTADLEDAALADYQARLDEAVTNGDLDQAEADRRLQRLAEQDFSRWLDVPFFMIPPIVEAWPLGDGDFLPFSGEEFPFGSGPGFSFPSGGPGEFSFGFSFGVDGAEPFVYQFNSDSPVFRQAAAEALGMTVEELASRLDAGEALYDIAESQGVDRQVLEDALRAAMVADAKAHLDEAVAAGDLTQEQADRILEEIEGGAFPRLHLFRPGESGDPFPLPIWPDRSES